MVGLSPHGNLKRVNDDHRHQIFMATGNTYLYTYLFTYVYVTLFGWYHMH